MFLMFIVLNNVDFTNKELIKNEPFFDVFTLPPLFSSGQNDQIGTVM